MSPHPRLYRILRLACVLLPTGLLVAGCDLTDPEKREGLWHPTGSPGRNLAMQVANPADLLIGRGMRGSDGQMAAAAIERMRADKTKPLPSASISSVGAAGGAAPAGGS